MVLLETTATRVEPGMSGHRQGAHATASRIWQCSHVLEAAGRVPNTDMLNLAATGVRTDERGYHPRRRPAGAPMSTASMPWATCTAGRRSRTSRMTTGASCARTSSRAATRRLPDVRCRTRCSSIRSSGRIGLGEDEARKAGKRIKVAKMPMSHVARALEIDETRGFMKIVVDAESDQILGAAILGIEGGEIMAQVQIAMLGKLTYTVLREAIFAHPTLAESLNNVFGSIVLWLETREDLLRHVLEDVLPVLLAQRRDAFDHGLQIVQHQPTARIPVRAGAGVLGTEHTAIAADHPGQELDALGVVENRVEIELLQLAVEPTRPFQVAAENARYRPPGRAPRRRRG